MILLVYSKVQTATIHHSLPPFQIFSAIFSLTFRHCSKQSCCFAASSSQVNPELLSSSSSSSLARCVRICPVTCFRLQLIQALFA
ncbi:hypothetical protein L3X38_005560 [Prunus dulcis]|uniref:Uncharacterized protein n=1 Tax=Prunus dulcis TaxID=3755 RepID=A0AAD5F489_PRUDU|nr:hypothetical protein L3X38_005560 [Prunus dulcis]